ncbi:gliding motility-associated-like protein [Arcicella aurantiaca]|uniref:Gliding motility-associated-like protein n=1 Tax=Arcicella aurantiaca TaxID=591202 RepID=A0A316EFS8_9BACT|nr:gliding motility-associated C-terminal domain-containing protein [Arcicella aurantiaca]PWK28553.1 gliding motility-associated-like protein [Arcicella aurantiaca]
MRNFTIRLLILLLLGHYSVIGQTQCGFESGSTAGWVLSYGKVTDNGISTIYSGEVTGTTGTGHIITQKSSGNDPKISNEIIPQVAPESNYSIRFGSVIEGSSFYRLTKSFTVNQENTLFQYKFAVVLQDDSKGHASYQKPGFGVKILDSNGNNITCSFYDVQLQASISVDGFKRQGDLEYRNWTTVAVDLRNYVGQNLTVEATVHGCTGKSHFGYAYFNATCLKSEIQPETGCADGNGQLQLDAPEGFEKYLWSTGETTRSILVSAVLGTQFSVKLSPYNSLNQSCNLQMNYTVKKTDIPAITNKSICAGESYVFRGTTYNTSGQYTQRIINSAFCDSVITLNLNVNPINYITKNFNICEGNTLNFHGDTYNSDGTYFKTITSSNACDSVFTINVKIVPIPRVSKSFSICAGEKVPIGDSTYTKAGTFITTIKRPNLCDSVVTASIQVENSFKASVPANVTIEKDESTFITVDVVPTGNYNYQWTPKDYLSCSNCASAWAKPPSSTKYTIGVSAIGSRCVNYATTTVNVLCGILVPTAFSPNNDSMNDILYIMSSKCVKQIQEMSIYDRWGELVFRDENFQAADASHGWDGNFRGKAMNPDIFTYKIVAEMKNGEINYFTGSVTLLK